MVSEMMWRRSFRGEAAQVGKVRQFVTALLAGCPVLDDALCCVTELASNAVVHSDSKLGTFTVEVWLSDQAVRLSVTDAGGDFAPSSVLPIGTDLVEGGRGLAIVAALSSRMGFGGNSAGRTFWAYLRWSAQEFQPVQAGSPLAPAMRH
jgi:anti-sigma regulatory factor (Ser/Thr protein kinase)